MYSFTIQHLL